MLSTPVVDTINFKAKKNNKAMTKNKTRLLELGVWPGVYVAGYTEAFLSSGKYTSINNFLDSVGFADELILAALIFIIFELASFNDKFTKLLVKNEDLMNAIEKNNARLRQNNEVIDSIKDKFDLVKTVKNYPIELQKIKHPYFVNLLNNQLNNILSNQEFITTPSSQETFGYEGIRTTKNNLRFISSFKDYWDDQSETEYDRTQDELIKRGVKIRRLFIDHTVTTSDDDLKIREVKDKQFESLVKQMESQFNRGIEVKYIPAVAISNNFKNKDGLIQDDELLVDLKLSDDGTHKKAVELITMNPYPIEKSIKEFELYWNQAKEREGAEGWRNSKCQS